MRPTETTSVTGMKKQMSLHPQTIRIRHRLVEGSKQGRKHWDLYRWLMDPYVLLDALTLVLKNQGSPGIDHERCKDIKGREWDYVTKLAQSLRERRYHPAAVRRVYIPKKDGSDRPLGIPRIRDQVIFNGFWEIFMKINLIPVFFIFTFFSLQVFAGSPESLNVIQMLLEA